jgi:DNA-binding MarR family transcriptional regulator
MKQTRGVASPIVNTVNGRMFSPVPPDEPGGMSETETLQADRTPLVADRLGVTPQQHRLLQFLRDRESLGLPRPSLDEMAAVLGLKAKSAAHRLVERLEERGYVRRIGARQRSVHVIYRAHPVADQLREALVAAVAALPEGCRLTPSEAMALIRETPLAP